MPEYRTNDLKLAAYLRMLGHEYRVLKKGRRAAFEFSSDVQKDVEDFFKNTGRFLEFYNYVRDAKASAINIL